MEIAVGPKPCSRKLAIVYPRGVRFGTGKGEPLLLEGGTPKIRPLLLSGKESLWFSFRLLDLWCGLLHLNIEFKSLLLGLCYVVSAIVRILRVIFISSASGAWWTVSTFLGAKSG